MTSFEAGAGLGRTSVRAAASAPPWVWVGLAVGVAALTWSVCRASDQDIPDWLDPNAPPLSAPTDYSTTLLGQLATAPGQPTGGRRRRRPYLWDSLMASPDCWVGDC